MSHATERHCTFTRWDQSGAQRTYDLLQEMRRGIWVALVSSLAGTLGRSGGQEARRPLRRGRARVTVMMGARTRQPLTALCLPLEMGQGWGGRTRAANQGEVSSAVAKAEEVLSNPSHTSQEITRSEGIV